MREAIGANSYSGTVNVFRVERPCQVMLEFWDGTGRVLVASRLEDEEFRQPTTADGTPQLASTELQALVRRFSGRHVLAVLQARKTDPRAAASPSTRTL